MGLKKINGAPFICMFAGMMAFAQLAIITDVQGEGLTGNSTQVVLDNTTRFMNQNSGTTTLVLSNTLTMKGEFIDNENSALYNKMINQITVRLDRDNSPSGWLYAGVWSGIPNPTLANAHFIIGQKYANSTSSNPNDYTFTRNDTRTYRLQTGDNVGIFCSGCSASPNVVNIAYDVTADKFDGANSYIRSFNVATQTWSNINPNDLRMKISLVEDMAIEEHEPYDFNQNDTWVFTIMLASFYILIGGMFQLQQWSKK